MWELTDSLLAVLRRNDRLAFYPIPTRGDIFFSDEKKKGSQSRH